MLSVVELFKTLYETKRISEGAPTQYPFVFFDREQVFYYFDTGVLSVRHSLDIGENDYVCIHAEKLSLLRNIFELTTDEDTQREVDLSFKTLKNYVRLTSTDAKYELTLQKKDARIDSMYVRIKQMIESSTSAIGAGFHPFDNLKFKDTLRYLTINHHMFEHTRIVLQQGYSYLYSDIFCCSIDSEIGLPDCSLMNSLFFKYAEVSVDFTEARLSSLGKDTALHLRKADVDLLLLCYEAEAMSTPLANIVSYEVPNTFASLSDFIKKSGAINLIRGNDTQEFGVGSQTSDYIKITIDSEGASFSTVDKEGNRASSLHKLAVVDSTPEGVYLLPLVCLENRLKLIEKYNFHIAIKPYNEDIFIFILKGEIDGLSITYAINGQCK